MALVTNNISGSSSNASKIGITGSVIIGNSTDAAFPVAGSDTVFFVSGSDSAKSVFGGTALVSGAFYVEGNTFIGNSLTDTLLVSGSTSTFVSNMVVSGSLTSTQGMTIAGDSFEITGSLTVTQGISGSLTRLSNGTSAFVGGNGILVTSASNGAVTFGINDSVVSTVSGTTFTGLVTIKSGSLVQPETGASGYSVWVSGSNSKGGANYIDFINVTNTAAGATNFNKWFRLNSTGDFEVVNSAYNSTIYTLKDDGAANFVGTITANSSSNLGTIIESMVHNVGSTGTVAFSLSNSSIFYVNNPAGNITANFTGAPTTNDRIISTTVILSQSSTARIVSAVQVDGVASTINWSNGITPTGNAGKQDVFGFSLIRSGSAWKTLGQMSTFG